MCFVELSLIADQNIFDSGSEINVGAGNCARVAYGITET